MWRKSPEVTPSSNASDSPFPSRFGTPTAGPIQSPPSFPQASQSTPARSGAAPAVQTAARATSANAASRIAAGLKVQGEFSGNSDLYIDGEATGKIRLADSSVTVGPNGRVHSDIEAREIVVEGSVHGNLKGTESVRLGSSSEVHGSLLAPRLAIDDGARFRGAVETVRPSQPVATPREIDASSADSDALQPVHAHAQSE